MYLIKRNAQLNIFFERHNSPAIPLELQLRITQNPVFINPDATPLERNSTNLHYLLAEKLVNLWRLVILPKLYSQQILFFTIERYEITFG